MRYKNLFSFGARIQFLAPNGCKGSYFLRYLSIKKAVEAIHGSRQKQETLLDPVYLDQQELASGAYEKMLYPME